MLEIGIFVYGVFATGLVALFAIITVKEMRRAGRVADARAETGATAGD